MPKTTVEQVFAIQRNAADRSLLNAFGSMTSEEFAEEIELLQSPYMVGHSVGMLAKATGILGHDFTEYGPAFMEGYETGVKTDEMIAKSEELANRTQDRYPVDEVMYREAKAARVRSRQLMQESENAPCPFTEKGDGEKM